jgi:hypothetical protein
MGKEDSKCMYEKAFLKECYLQKTNEYDALKIIGDSKEKYNSDSQQKEWISPLGVGMELMLKKEKGDDDKEHVFAEFEGKKVGVLADDESKDIMKYLYAGWEHVFECRISKVDEKGDENKRFCVAIYVKKNESEKKSVPKG